MSETNTGIKVNVFTKYSLFSHKCVQKWWQYEMKRTFRQMIHTSDLWIQNQTVIRFDMEILDYRILSPIELC